MVRSWVIASILSVGLVAAGLGFSRSEGDCSACSSPEWRTMLSLTDPQPSPPPACLGAEPTLERWGDLRPDGQKAHSHSAQEPRSTAEPVVCG